MRILMLGLVWVSASLSGLAYAGERGSDDSFYVRKGGDAYHRWNCRLLEGQVSRAIKGEKKDGYKPCPVCRPGGEGGDNARQGRGDSSLGPCTGITHDGKRCSRNADEGSSFCWQHQAEKPRDDRTRCIALTKKGTRCSRNAEKDKAYCWQHK